MSESPHDDHDGMGIWLISAILFTIFMSIGAGVVFSGAGNDMTQWMFEKFFKAKAKAEEKALEHIGEEKAQSFLKDQLKKNPVISNDELNEISGGLGDEAAREFGGKLSRAFD